MAVEPPPRRQPQRDPESEGATAVAVADARMGADIDPRLREIAGGGVTQLHAAVKEVEPTHEAWLAAIASLTETGHMCTDWRQAFILPSDTLGVSMLVDAQATAPGFDAPFWPVDGDVTRPARAAP